MSTPVKSVVTYVIQIFKIWALDLERASSDVVAEIAQNGWLVRSSMLVGRNYAQGFIVQTEGKVTVLYQLMER